MAAVDPALTPDPALVARFRTDLEALTGEVPSADRRLGLAVSGGGDSVALLLLAAVAYPGAVAAATVDHGLRHEAAAEAAGVGALCARLGVAHAILAVPGDFVFTGNLQNRARTVRYALLADWAKGGEALRDPPGLARWVATGHQQNDVAETFLMRARRGAGVGGLAAMRARRRLSPWPVAPALIRPLLGWSRAALAGIVATAGWEPAADPGNVDPRFDRSRVRALIAATADLPPSALARAALNLRDAEEALEWATDREWTARHAIEAYETVTLDVDGLPHEIRRRLVDRALDYIRFEFATDVSWRGASLDRFVRLLEAGRPATLAGILARPGARWRFTLAPPRRAS